MGAEGGFTIIDRGRLDSIGPVELAGLCRSFADDLEVAARYASCPKELLRSARLLHRCAAGGYSRRPSDGLLAVAGVALATIIEGEIYGHEVLMFGWGTNIGGFLNILDDRLRDVDVIVASEETWT